MWSNGSVDVTLVEANAEFVSCPMSNLVLGGSKDLAFLTTSYANLAARHGVRIVRDTATTVDPTSASCGSRAEPSFPTTG